MFVLFVREKNFLCVGEGQMHFFVLWLDVFELLTRPLTGSGALTAADAYSKCEGKILSGNNHGPSRCLRN